VNFGGDMASMVVPLAVETERSFAGMARRGKPQGKR